MAAILRNYGVARENYYFKEEQVTISKRYRFLDLSGSTPKLTIRTGLVVHCFLQKIIY